MSFHRGFFGCKTAPPHTATAVAVTHVANYQLQNDIISGPTCPIHYSLPDEGVYILCGNRALQIAGPFCDRRRCNFHQICHCDPERSSNNITERPLPRVGRYKRPCHDYLVSWMHLYEATEAAYMTGMSILAVPRTLTLASSAGYCSYVYDTYLEENNAYFSYDYLKSSVESKSCSSLWFSYMVDGWTTFLDRGSYKPNRSIVSIPDSDDDSDFDSTDVEDEWDDWDDSGVPLGDSDSEYSEENDDYFDLIGDLIEKEFPKLKGTCSRNQEDASLIEDADIYDDPPAPVIIPPKNMVVGRGLVR
ncbi:hypothetical protein F4810DRAFT_717333 [Camillea tinctor]|nr:hypothetical protein F4810DRAFT_717333 [Camillea tinctor]